MKTYQTYSTSLKIYYSLGLQNEFVSQDLRSVIPTSTANNWKKTQFDSVIGRQLEKDIQNNLSEIQLLYHPHGTIPKKISYRSN